MSVSTEEKYLTVKDLADLFGVSVWTIYRLCKDWPQSGVGRGIRFSREDVEAIKMLIRKGDVQPAESTPKYTPAQLARASKRLGLPGPRQAS